MVEYNVVRVSNLSDDSIKEILNKLAENDWAVVCSLGSERIIVERIIDEGVLLAEEVLRRQFTYSLPGMEGKDIGIRG